MQPLVRVSPETSEDVNKLLAELKIILVQAIDLGGWNGAIRERMTYFNTRALAIVRVGLEDPQSSTRKDGGAPGTIHLCISYLWDMESEPVMPPPRVFIPSSRNTTTVFELAPEHVPGLLDCYRRILEAVDGPEEGSLNDSDSGDDNADAE